MRYQTGDLDRPTTAEPTVSGRPTPPTSPGGPSPRGGPTPGGTGPVPGGAGRGTVAAVLVLTALAAACIGSLQLAIGYDPVRTMVSDYAHTPLGGVLLPAGLLAFAGAVVLLARALARAGMADRRDRRVLGVVGAGLVLIAAYHGDATGTGTTAVGLVHKAGGVLLFGGLPLAGWWLSRRCLGHPEWYRLAAPLRLLAVPAGVLAALLLLGCLPGLGWAIPGGDLLTTTHGLVERCALVLDVALVTLPAMRLARLAARPPARPAYRQPHPPARSPRPADRVRSGLRAGTPGPWS